MLRAFPRDLLQKVLENLVYYVHQAFWTVNPVVMACFVLALLAMPSAMRLGRLLANLVAMWLVTTIVVVSAVAKEPRYLAPFAPLIVVTATGYAFHQVWRRVPSRPGRWAATAALAVALLGVPVGKLVYEWTLPPAPPRLRDPNLAAVGRLTDREAVIVSDIGRSLTWYLGRRAVQAPIDRQTLDRIDREILPVSAIYLSGAAAARWRHMFGRDGFAPEGYVPDRFALVEAFPDGGRLYRRRGAR
jgi:hypothetical protein